MVTIRIPAPSPGVLSNLVGLFGLIAIVCAVGALTNWRWGLLAAGLFAVGLAMLSQRSEQPAARPQSVPDNVRRHRAAAARAA